MCAMITGYKVQNHCVDTEDNLIFCVQNISSKKYLSSCRRCFFLPWSKKECVIAVIRHLSLIISLISGIGDYRGKSGKWTEMDREDLDMDSLAKTEKVIDRQDSLSSPVTKRRRLSSVETPDDSLQGKPA